ncbi:MAG TPA: hypothetical protein VIV11_22530 [Kofleriaceae bacterium]
MAVVAFANTGRAEAQTAAALGKPLPSPDMAKGTLSVRVVAGTPSSPVTGTEVTLIVNGATRVARTDSAGRAHFKDLPPDAKLQAKVLDEDKKDCGTCVSDEFQLPPDTGARLMLSTRPWNPGAAAGPAMAGGAQPNPRQMTGEPRPDANDPPGQITVRLSYDDFKDAPPVDVAVALVGYAHDGKVVTKIEKTDKEGRAKFTGLDRTGATAYFAMTQLPRNNATDRVTSTPVMLDPRAGVRMILSSEKRASTAAAIDDLSKLERQDGAPAAGKVRVSLEGGPDPSATVTLVDAEQGLVIARAKSATAAPDPTDVQVQANFDDKADIPAGTLRINVHGGSHSDDPLSGVKARLVVASAPDKTAAAELVTDASGSLELKTMTPEPVIAVLVVNGKELSSKPLDLTKKGGQLELTARWPAEGKPEVMFDLVPRPGQIVYVETTMHGQLYRTLPFQPVAERGTRVTLFIFPRVLFSFSLTSRIDDEYLAVNGKFEVSNNSWMPYVGGPDGLLLPLPKGFMGGLVAEKDQGDVALTPGEGFRIVRPIAPGQRTFHGAFSLQSDGGEVTWNWDLPLGAFNSGIEILQVPGMHVQTPPNVRGETATIPQGTFFVLPQISILPKQSMVMTISGLPSAPGWRVWLPRFIGIIVVGLMIAGVVFALNRSKADAAATAERDARRQKLLDELVELEKHDKTSKTEKRREQLMAELEKLWDDAA